MSSQMIRDRAGVVDGVSNIPDYLKYKSKRVQTSVFQKRRVKDDILSNANATGGAVIRARIGSQAFIDPKSLRVSNTKLALYQFQNTEFLHLQKRMTLR